MELRQLDYIIKIAEESSIKKAAERLFISQSGLNQHLLKLEADLGIQLFHRSKNDLRLTEAGKVYVDYSRQILLLKHQAYDILNDMADNKVGRLCVGLTSERGMSMFMGIYPEFFKQFPEIPVEPQEISVKNQQEMISKGYLDLGFVTLTEKDKINNEYLHIYYEDILLAVPRSLASSKNITSSTKEPYPVVNLIDFADERFVIVTKNSSLRPIIDDLFDKSNFTPNILFETSSTPTLYTTVRNNLACSLLPRHYAFENENISYFQLSSNPTWELCATYRKGHYLTKTSKVFIDLAIDYFNNNTVRKSFR